MSRKKDLTGKRFGKLTVVSYAFNRETLSGAKMHYWNCLCDCGNEKIVLETALKNGYTKSCGCHRKEVLHNIKSNNLTGQRFGKLVALEYLFTDKSRHNVWLCKCDCGKTKEVPSDLLITGHTRSCGCIGSSLGEAIIEETLDELGLSYKREVEFEDQVTEKGGKMRFDFGIYQKEKLLLLIEFQGEQHYNHMKDSFGDYQRTVTDPAKKIYCKEKNIPLVEIKFSDDVKYSIYDMLFSEAYSHVNSVPSSNIFEKV